MIEELVSRLYAALAVGDRSGVEALLDESFVAQFSEGLPEGIGGRHEGDQAIDAGWWALGKLFRVAAEPDEHVRLVDGRLLVLGRYRGSARRSGRQLDAAFAHVWRAKGERLVELSQITDTALWLAALKVDG
jgi:ketosteroid isomerase-like protein